MGEDATYIRFLINKDYDKILEKSYYRLHELIDNRYIGKTILEHLLKEKIHNRVMDNYAIKHKEWISLYIKYDVVEPLIKSNLKELLSLDGKELLLDKLLKKLNMKQKMILYKNMKSNNLWLFAVNEDIIINSYAKHNINLNKRFITSPRISDQNINVGSSFNDLLLEFRKSFSDHDECSLNTAINEFKRKVKIDHYRTVNDIKLFIDYKKQCPNLKILTENITLLKEEDVAAYYPNTKTIIINNYEKDVLSHEFSHLLFCEFELENIVKDNPNNPIYFEAVYSIYKNKIKESRKEEIKKYINDLHERFENMFSVFNTLYIKEINRKYGNRYNYMYQIFFDILGNKPESIWIDKDKEVHIYISDTTNKEEINEIFNTILNLIDNLRNKYICDLTLNYYREELNLENLLDAIVDGDIFSKKYSKKCLSGHSKKYFRSNRFHSFDEAIADYDAIKNSYKANQLITKLRSIVGDDMVDLLEEYLDNRKRNEKRYVKKR